MQSGSEGSSPSIFGSNVPIAGLNKGPCKSVSTIFAGTSPLCPNCCSKKAWRDGSRYNMFDDKIQRWLCKDCGHRFSDPEDVQKARNTFEIVEMIETKSLKSQNNIVNAIQICATETKNLVLS